ncbi:MULTISPECIES: Nif11 family protein [unclassified Sphingomonas]|uniref:Nif11 family protein n=1 Tax=unclassified Sphingomonas TaxID=196159 RepID=UPI0008360903|nr:MULTISPECIES: Nif11 family protein [unclassified Sphingomonas]
MMSLANALRFLELIERDSRLRSELANVAGTTELSRVAEFAADHGFPCDAPELRQAWRKRRMLQAAVEHSARIQSNKPIV